MTQEMLDTVLRQINERKIEDIVRAPKVGQTCPVNAIKVNGPGDKLAYIVSDPLGRIVEIITDGPSEDVEERFMRRWPWYSTPWAERFGITGSRMTWPMIVNVENKEFKRLVNLEPWSADALKLRSPAGKRERWAALSSAVSNIYGSQFKAWGVIDNTAITVVYHRPISEGGNHTSAWVSTQMAKLVKLGAINRCDKPKTTKPRVYRICGQYQPTDLTPNPHNLNR